MQIEAIIDNQEQFISQFAQQAQAEVKRCLNTGSILFPEEAGDGTISYTQHNHFIFIVSSVLLKEEFLFRCPESAAKSKFVDFGFFLDGNIESSFLFKQERHHLELEQGTDFQHFSMLMPRKMVPQNKSRKELRAIFQRFVALPLIQTQYENLLKTKPTLITQAIIRESKALELLSNWLSFMQNNLIPQENQLVLSDYEQQCIAHVKSILKESFINPPTIKQLSRSVGINEMKLKTGFKLLCDTTIRQYVIHLRMEKAKMLLEQSNNSIGVIAHKVGYDQQGYFAYLFKRFYGIAPHIYQKNCQELVNKA